MPGSAFDPPALPDAFWVRADVRQALAARDIGALFRLVSNHGGISQTRIGTAVEMSQARVSLVSRGLQFVRELALITRIADGLGMPDHARTRLGIAPRQAAAHPASLATGDSNPDEAAELLRRMASARYIDDEVAQLLQDETEAIRQLDRRLGAPAVAAKLTAHIDQLSSTLHHTLTPGRRQQLALVLADAAALAGWQAIDTGHLTTAWNHFETATAAAREADDSSLLTFAAGEQSYVLLDLGQPADALTKIRATREQAGTRVPGKLRCWLHAAEAEMSAAIRQQAECRAALDLAASQLDRPSDGHLPYLALNDAHLARWRGNCLVHFGDPATVTDLTAALAGMDGTFARAEAALRCDLATALHTTGDRSEARRHLARATELAQLTGSVRQRRRIAQLTRKIGRAA